MKIEFDILDTEADIIAAEYGFDGASDRDAFVLEIFKDFGRTCLLSKVKREIVATQEVEKQADLDSAKTSISF